MEHGERSTNTACKQRKVYRKVNELRIKNRVEILRWSTERDSWQSMKSTVIEENKHGTKPFL